MFFFYNTILYSLWHILYACTTKVSVQTQKYTMDEQRAYKKYLVEKYTSRQYFNTQKCLFLHSRRSNNSNHHHHCHHPTATTTKTIIINHHHHHHHRFGRHGSALSEYHGIVQGGDAGDTSC